MSGARNGVRYGIEELYIPCGPAFSLSPFFLRLFCLQKINGKKKDMEGREYKRGSLGLQRVIVIVHCMYIILFILISLSLFSPPFSLLHFVAFERIYVRLSLQHLLIINFII